MESDGAGSYGGPHGVLEMGSPTDGQLDHEMTSMHASSVAFSTAGSANEMLSFLADQVLDSQLEAVINSPYMQTLGFNACPQQPHPQLGISSGDSAYYASGGSSPFHGGIPYGGGDGNANGYMHSSAYTTGMLGEQSSVKRFCV